MSVIALECCLLLKGNSALNYPVLKSSFIAMLQMLSLKLFKELFVQSLVQRRDILCFKTVI